MVWPELEVSNLNKKLLLFNKYNPVAYRGRWLTLAKTISILIGSFIGSLCNLYVFFMVNYTLIKR